MSSLKLYKRAQKNFGLQQVRAEWIEFIKFLMVAQPKTVLEIGTYKGGSAYTFAHFADLIITVDNNNLFKPKKQNIISRKSQLYFINRTSKNPRVLTKINHLLRFHRREVDLLLIDADHTYRGAKRDFQTYSPLVKPGGHIVLHDITKSSYHIQLGCLIYKFWEELKLQYSNTTEITKNKKWGGLGIIKL